MCCALRAARIAAVVTQPSNPESSLHHHTDTDRIGGEPTHHPAPPIIPAWKQMPRHLSTDQRKRKSRGRAPALKPTARTRRPRDSTERGSERERPKPPQRIYRRVPISRSISSSLPIDPSPRRGNGKRTNTRILKYETGNKIQPRPCVI